MGSTTIAYAIVYAVYGLYLCYILKRSGPYRPIAFALFWTALEYAKSVGFLGYPWGLLPYTQTLVLPVLQIAELTGVYGLSFLVSLCNGAIAEILSSRRTEPSLALPAYEDIKRRSSRRASTRRLPYFLELISPPALSRNLALRYACAALALTGLVLGFGFYRLANPAPQTGSFTAVLVQQNSDPWGEDEAQGILTNIDLARRAIKKAGKKPDIVFFSESSLSRPYKDFHSWYLRHPAQDPLIPFVIDNDCYLFTGAPIVINWDSYEATNSVILISPKAEQVGDYAKVHPVPFAEAIPFWEFAAFRAFMQMVVGLESGWVMGKEFRLFEFSAGGRTIRFGAPICFEDAFPDVCRQFALQGTDLFINLTNDSWSKTRSSEIQHYAAARFRSIEFRKTLVRSTNGGLSCVIDAEGRILSSLPFFQADSMLVEVPIYATESPSLYTRFGDWFALLDLLLFAALFLIVYGRDKHERRRGHEH